MLQTKQILVRVIALVGFAAIAGGFAAALSGCGQPGPLYLPTEPAAARRATLPEILIPGMRSDGAAPTPAAPASAPASK